MPKIRVLIYRLQIITYRPKLSFSDQEKFLKEVVFSLKVSTNVNTENSQIKRCSCLKYLVIYRPDLYNLQARKTSEKMTKSWILSFKLCNYKKPPISTLPRNLTCRPDLYNLKTRKS